MDEQSQKTTPDEAKGEKELSVKLLELLVCPVTKGPLKYDSEAKELVSKSAKLAYPVRNGVPIMLPDDARPLDDA